MIFEHDTAPSSGMILAVARILPQSAVENSEPAASAQDVKVLWHAFLSCTLRLDSCLSLITMICIV